jgi:hypothetical protein
MEMIGDDFLLKNFFYSSKDAKDNFSTTFFEDHTLKNKQFKHKSLRTCSHNVKGLTPCSTKMGNCRSSPLKTN